MNEKFTNNMNRDDEAIARKLDQVAEQTHANAQFAAELEEQLRNAYQPKSSWFAQISPTLRWVALMVLLALVLSWSIKSLIPMPQPAMDNTPVVLETATPLPSVPPDENATPTIPRDGYNWRGTKFHLDTSLPTTPTEASVHLFQADQQLSIEEAHTLAQQLGIEGGIYMASNDGGYTITNGKQQLGVQVLNNGSMHFVYSADPDSYHYPFMSGGRNISPEDASRAIDNFLKTHGFDFNYQLEKGASIPGYYYVLPLTEDGLTIRHDHNRPAGMEFIVTDEGQIILVISDLIGHDTVGSFGIKTAEEAFQQVLASSNSIQNGVLEYVHSGGISEEYYWDRRYPDNQTITIYGYSGAIPSVEAGKPPLVSIDQYTVQGQIEGLDKLTNYALDYRPLVEATGQFSTSNGIRIFNVESWKITDGRAYWAEGSLVLKDGAVTMSVEGKDHVLPDVPEDVPLGTPYSEGNSQISVEGYLVNEDFIWQTIFYYPDAGLNQGGGGGGGGTGFYKLNLSGTPVPFPSPTAQPSIPHTVREGDTCGGLALFFGVSVRSIVTLNNLPANCIISVGQTLFIPGQQTENPYVGRRFEGQRGTLMINIYNKADGNMSNEFVFMSTNEDGSLLYALLEDVSLEELLAYQNRPIDIWGTVNYVNESGISVIAVERYEAPYPDLQFQIVQGTQDNIEIDGNPVTIFTTDDGKSYVQMSPDGSLSIAIVGDIGDKVSAEVLIIPDELFQGYPTMRMFNIGLATNPKNGEPVTISVTADQPNVMDGVIAPEDYVPPDATIEKVELVYYIPDPRSALPALNSPPQYIQPAWRFYGHYSNGDEFEILVQALKQEFLLPELAPYTPPG
jgi:LysM repeat protein